MATFITILIIIASILLILAVLIQNPKGGGIASNFSAGNNIMGVRRTSELIEKWTWGLAIAIIVLTLASGAYTGIGQNSDNAVPASQMQEKIDNAPGMAIPSAPAQEPAPQQESQD
jgi:preprotein translocase subunit SecG